MKKPNSKNSAAEEPEMQPEYDFSKAKHVGNKHIARLSKGSNVVVIDPDLHKKFPDSEAVNAALRTLVNATRRA
ncbi:MAG: hypothetical protein V4642_14360 [Bacteroidota bacterium]